jgi:hypothetical protein
MIRKTHASQQLSDSLVNLGTGHITGQSQRHGNVVGHSLRGQQIEVLKDHPDLLAKAPQTVSVESGDVFTVNDDLSSAGRFEAVDEAQQGTFAGTGMADQTEHLAVFDAQAGRVQGRDFLVCNPVGFVDVMKLDHVANLVGRGKNSAQWQDALG